MQKQFFGCAVALTTMVSLVSAQQQYMRIPPGSPVYEINAENVANGGTLVYDNSYVQIDPDVASCGANVTCEDCGDFFITSIWTAAGATGDRRFFSDDITLGVGPRQLVRYNVMVCGTNTVSTPVNITTELWTLNLDGLANSAPGAPIAGTLTTTPVVIDATFPCFIINVKTTPGIILPEKLHLVVGSNFQSVGSNGTFVTALDAVEYGSSLNQFRRSATGVAAPAPNTNANWAGASQFSATPNCPIPGGASCTTNPGPTANCLPYANAWAHIYATGSCGNGTIEPGEACDSTDPCCQGCQFAPINFQCRASAGACDPAEACTGASAVCPADMISAPGVPCRPSSGPCDFAESCDGVNVACPPDLGITTCTNGDGCCPVGCTNGNDNDCAPVGVPTVSEWGLAVLTLIGLVVGTVLFSRKRSLA